MNKLIPTLGAAALSLAALSSAQAATHEEAQAMLKAALTEIQAKGMEVAAKEFSAGGSWNKGTLYVFVSDFKANIVAHSANEKLVGKNLWEVKDASGKLFLQEEVHTMQSAASGTVRMRWMNPSTKQIDDAEAVMGRVPGQDVFVGAVWFK
jgi:cytochrome c